MKSPQLEAGAHGDTRYYDRPLNYSFIWKLQHRPRRKIYERFVQEFHPKESDRILDIGVANLQEPLENFFEAYYPYKHQITTAGIEDCSFLEKRYAGIKFVPLESGRTLPFADNAFDLGFSSATIEHVGNRSQQSAFVMEMLRVCRKIFLTTPNRWYPFELHTRLPLIHWLPPETFRRLLRKLGYPFYALEENLNLLSAREMRALVPPGPWRVRIERNYFMGFPSNLLLIIEKTEAILSS